MPFLQTLSLRHSILSFHIMPHLRYAIDIFLLPLPSISFIYVDIECPHMPPRFISRAIVTFFRWWRITPHCFRYYVLRSRIEYSFSFAVSHMPFIPQERAAIYYRRLHYHMTCISAALHQHYHIYTCRRHFTALQHEYRAITPRRQHISIMRCLQAQACSHTALCAPRSHCRHFTALSLNTGRHAPRSFTITPRHSCSFTRHDVSFHIISYR
jgi:hypothetical protein